MELWVRSQDREILTPINKPITYWINEEGRYSIVYKESPSYVITLSTFSTKERALEVLDEIQNKLLDNVIATNDDGYATLLENTCFYEMPKE